MNFIDSRQIAKSVASSLSLQNVEIIALAASLVMSLGCSRTNQLQNLALGSAAPQPDTVTFVIKNYKPQSGNTIQNIFASNFSVKVANGQLYYSTARDGFSDVEKTSLASTYGFLLNVSETPTRTTNFADLFLYRLGIVTSQQSSMYCASSYLASSSNDMLTYTDTRITSTQVLGLRDCEKIYLGLTPSSFDTAGNGIPDYMKLRCGINMLSKNAAYISTSGDGMSDLEKCRRHIPLDENAYTQPNQLYAYQYSTTLNTDGTTDLTIANIPLLNSGTDNFIAFYITEASGSSTTQSLYTAFTILTSSSKNKTVNVPYWAPTSDSTKFLNQQIVVP